MMQILGFGFLVFCGIVILIAAVIGLPLLFVLALNEFSPLQVGLAVVALFILLVWFCVPRVIRLVRQRRLAKDQPLARVIRIKLD